MNELEQLLAEANDHAAEVGRLLSELTPDQLQWRPRPNKWCIGEHIDHLARTTERYARAIRVAIHNARKHGIVGGGPFRRSLFGSWFVRSLEPPVRIPIKTFPILLPERHASPDDLKTDFSASLNAFTLAVREAEGVDLGKATMRSPFVKVLRLTIGEALEAVLAHHRRHLWHIRRISNDRRFKSLASAREPVPPTAEP